MTGTESKCTIDSSGGGKCTIDEEETKVHNSGNRTPRTEDHGRFPRERRECHWLLGGPGADNMVTCLV